MARKKFKRVVDNKMRDFGDTNIKKGVIRVNKKKSRKHPKGIIDTVIHEELHARHPKMHEKTVRKLTNKALITMSPKRKADLMAGFSRTP